MNTTESHGPPITVADRLRIARRYAGLDQDHGVPLSWIEHGFGPWAQI